MGGGAGEGRGRPCNPRAGRSPCSSLTLPFPTQAPSPSYRGTWPKPEKLGPPYFTQSLTPHPHVAHAQIPSFSALYCQHQDSFGLDTSSSSLDLLLPDPVFMCICVSLGTSMPPVGMYVHAICMPGAVRPCGMSAYQESTTPRQRGSFEMQMEPFSSPAYDPSRLSTRTSR